MTKLLGLYFNLDGNVSEIIIDENILLYQHFDYSFRNKLYRVYVVPNNNDNNNNVNKTIKLPFSDNFNNNLILLNLDKDYNIKSLSFKKYSEIIIKNSLVLEYSSDDFSPDTCDNKGIC